MSETEPQVVPLPQKFVQVQLGSLKEIIDHHHADGHQVQLDAALVERVDGAAMQFLLVLSKLQEQSKVDSVLLINAGEVLLNALQDMGLDNMVSLSKSASKAVA